MHVDRSNLGYHHAPTQVTCGAQMLPCSAMYLQSQHPHASNPTQAPLGIMGTPCAYPSHPTYMDDCPHMCTHYSRKRRRHRYHHHEPRSSLLTGALAWLRDLFSFLCCGCGRFHCAQEMNETPWLWSPAEQRLAYLQRARNMRCGQHFSPRFLAETRAARKYSRLNLDALVKDTDNGILSSQSLESLELELLERSVRKRRHQARLKTSWSTSQPVLYYGSNTHNSEMKLRKIKKRSKSTPSLFAEGCI